MADDIDSTAPEAKASKSKGKKAAVAAPIVAEAETLASEAEGTAESLKATAGKLGKQAAEKARDYANEGKARASGALSEVSRLMDQAAGTVDEKLGADYGKYAHNAAETISGWSDQLKNKELDDFANDAREFVRKSPVVAVGIAAALGFILARAIRAGTDKNA